MEGRGFESVKEDEEEEEEEEADVEGRGGGDVAEVEVCSAGSDEVISAEDEVAVLIAAQPTQGSERS